MKSRHLCYHYPTICRPIAMVAAGLLLGSALPGPSLAEEPESAVRPLPGSEQGLAITGEVRQWDDSLLAIAPWAPRLPARVYFRTSGETRYLRQRKGKLSDLRLNDLVLVVEQPPNGAERRSRKEQETALKQGHPQVPTRAARARAVLRCWQASGAEPTPEERQAARALLNGALPFFRGPSRGSVKPPSDDTTLTVGTISSLRPLTLRTNKGPVRYQAGSGTLVVDHLPESPKQLKRGQSVLVHTRAEPGAADAIEATIIAISPRPRLRPSRERRLIIRERKQTHTGG